MRKIVRMVFYGLLVFCVISLILELSGRSKSSKRRVVAGQDATLGVSQP